MDTTVKPGWRDFGRVDALARFDALLALLSDLAEENHRVPILVEGPRDAATLRAFGCAGEIVAFQSGEGLAIVVERVVREHPRVILLPDWDERGERHFDQLATLCAGAGARVEAHVLGPHPARAQPPAQGRRVAAAVRGARPGAALPARHGGALRTRTLDGYPSGGFADSSGRHAFNRPEAKAPR